jgi:hypothetical protein
MLRAEDNQFLTESGAGTPMGALLRDPAPFGRFGNQIQTELFAQ